MRCDCRECMYNKDGYCEDSSYVEIGTDGICKSQIIIHVDLAPTEKPTTCPHCGGALAPRQLCDWDGTPTKGIEFVCIRCGKKL